MDRTPDPFVPLHFPSLEEEFGAHVRRASMGAPQGAVPALNLAPAIARLYGFDVTEQPVIHALGVLPGEVLACRSTLALRRDMIGREVLVVFEAGNVRRPIVIGLLEPPATRTAASTPAVAAQVNGAEREVIEAEREVVLRCGAASITLTRAGKVIINGNYVLCRSAGYNRIKGAAVDIN